MNEHHFPKQRVAALNGHKRRQGQRKQAIRQLQARAGALRTGSRNHHGGRGRRDATDYDPAFDACRTPTRPFGIPLASARLASPTAPACSHRPHLAPPSEPRLPLDRQPARVAHAAVSVLHPARLARELLRLRESRWRREGVRGERRARVAAEGAHRSVQLCGSASERVAAALPKGPPRALCSATRGAPAAHRGDRGCLRGLHAPGGREGRREGRAGLPHATQEKGRPGCRGLGSLRHASGCGSRTNGIAEQPRDQIRTT